MIRLIQAEILKQGKRPIHRRLLIALPAFCLLAALLFVVLKIVRADAELPGGPGTGLAFATSLFGFFGVIFAVATASSVGSSEYEYATARLVFTQEPRRWRHAIARAITVLSWLLALVLLIALTGTLFDLAIGLHRTVTFQPSALGTELANLGRAGATAYPVVLLGLLAATWTRNLLGGLFVALVYSLFDRVVTSLAQVPPAALPGWLDAILQVTRALAPWLLSGLGSALSGEPGAWPAGVAVGLLVVYVVGLTGLLALLLERRDVA